MIQKKVLKDSAQSDEERPEKQKIVWAKELEGSWPGWGVGSLSRWSGVQGL